MRKLIAVPVAASLLAFAVPAAHAEPTKAYVITAKLSDSSIQLGDSVKVAGTVSGPGAVGSKVFVYIHYANDASGEYDYAGSDTIDSNGKYSRKFTPNDSGDTVVKVVKEASSSRKRATKSVNLDTYGWVPLLTTNFARVVEDGVVSEGAVSFEGGLQTYDGIRFKLDGRARYDLKKKCTNFSALSGTDDASDVGSFGQAKPLALKSNLNTLREGVAGSNSVGDSPDNLTLHLYASSDHSIRARYLEITTQLDGSDTDDTWGIARADVYCNLPGGVLNPA